MKYPKLLIRWHQSLSLVGLLTLAVAALSTSPGTAFGQESSHSSGWVVIPVDEYRVLRAKAYPVEHDPEPPPIDATLTRVDYDLHITGDLAAGRASLTVDVLIDGWVRVPIPSGLLVREARLDGKLVSLVPAAAGKGGAQLSVLLSHVGISVVLLDVNVPLTSTAGGEVSSAPSTRQDHRQSGFGRDGSGLGQQRRRAHGDLSRACRAERSLRHQRRGPAAT